MNQPLGFLNGSGEGTSVRDRDKDYANAQLSLMFANETLNKYFMITPNTIAFEGGFTIVSNDSQNPLLDYEKQGFKLEFIVDAIHPENTTSRDSAIFTIVLEDANDNTPTFDQPSYSVTIKEDLSDLASSDFVLLAVSASDKDISPKYGNQSIRYSLVDPTVLQGALSVDPVTGEVKADLAKASAFDVDCVSCPANWTVGIQAEDCGGEDCDDTSNVNEEAVYLTISVENVNDNIPYLVNPCETSFLNIDELSFQLEAVDEDKDRVSFMMTDPGSSFPFSITENGLLSVETGAIDEAFGPREFQITLTDNREPVQTSNTTCNITINDVNDKNPNFTFPAFDQKYWIGIVQ